MVWIRASGTGSCRTDQSDLVLGATLAADLSTTAGATTLLTETGSTALGCPAQRRGGEELCDAAMEHCGIRVVVGCTEPHRHAQRRKLLCFGAPLAYPTCKP